MNKEIKIKDLGLVEYKQAWDYQEELLNKIVEVKKKNRNEGSNDSTKNYLISIRFLYFHLTILPILNIMNILMII